MSSETSTFWIVAGTGDAGAARTHCSTFKAGFTELANLKFGGVNQVIQAVDDISRGDTTAEGVLRRIERSWQELSSGDDGKTPSAATKGAEAGKVKFEPKILVQNRSMDVLKYLDEFKWNERCFDSRLAGPRLLQLMSEGLNKLDETLRNKLTAYNEAKALNGNLKVRDGNYMTKDLVDIIKVRLNQTQHLTTLVIIMPKGGEKEFGTWYEKAEDMKKRGADDETAGTAEGRETQWKPPVEPQVVPKSLAKLDIGEDKDGNTIWTVLVFKGFVETFKKRLREGKYGGAVARDFTFDEAALPELEVKRRESEEKEQQLKEELAAFCKQAWSQAFDTWVHIKGMRVFAEGVALFGPEFQTYLLCPTKGKENEVRKALEGLGNNTTRQIAKETAEADGEECFSYASVSFQPVSTK